MSHDLTVFKNFVLRGAQKRQFRAGFFNTFNAAYATERGHRVIEFVLKYYF